MMAIGSQQTSVLERSIHLFTVLYSYLNYLALTFWVTDSAQVDTGLAQISLVRPLDQEEFLLTPDGCPTSSQSTSAVWAVKGGKERIHNLCIFDPLPQSQILLLNLSKRHLHLIKESQWPSGTQPIYLHRCTISNLVILIPPKMRDPCKKQLTENSRLLVWSLGTFGSKPQPFAPQISASTIRNRS